MTHQTHLHEGLRICPCCKREFIPTEWSHLYLGDLIFSPHYRNPHDISQGVCESSGKPVAVIILDSIKDS